PSGIYRNGIINLFSRCSQNRPRRIYCIQSPGLLFASSRPINGGNRMKRMILVVLGILAVSAVPFSQKPEIAKALLPAPRKLKADATVIKWKPDFTYETLKKGTNRLVCYDRSGQPGQQPFAVECTSLGNLERVAQTLKIEAANSDPKTRRTAFEAFE